MHYTDLHCNRNSSLGAPTYFWVLSLESFNEIFLRTAQKIVYALRFILVYEPFTTHLCCSFHVYDMFGKILIIRRGVQI